MSPHLHKGKRSREKDKLEEVVGTLGKVRVCISPQVRVGLKKKTIQTLKYST